MDTTSFYPCHGPRQSHILETPPKSEQTRCEMVRRITGLLVRDQTCPRQNSHCSRFSLKTLCRRQRRTRQRKRGSVTPETLCQHSNSSFRHRLHLRRTGRDNRKHPKPIPATHEKLAERTQYNHSQHPT